MRKIKLTQGKVALVDDCDYEFLVAMGPWNFNNGYAKRWSRSKPRQKIYMHREIAKRAGLDMSNEIDHRDSDDPDNQLNNQRHNLRPATRRQNSQNRRKHRNNTSGTTGVYRFRKGWRARIFDEQGRPHCHNFATKKEAITSRNNFVAVQHGEFGSGLKHINGTRPCHK